MPTYATGTSGYIGSKLQSTISLDVDLCDKNTFSKKVIEPASTVINLAAIVGAQRVLENPELAFKVNVEGAVDLADYLIRNTDARLIQVSTSHVYKSSDNKHSEHSETGPNSLYAKQKLDAEKRLQALFAIAPQRLLIVRVFSILGRNMPAGTLGWAIERANTKNPIKNSDDVRDFSTAREVARTLEKLSVIDWHHPILNICSGSCRSVRDAGIALRRELQLNDEEGIFQKGNSNVPKNCGDNSLLKQTITHVDMKHQ
jgi:dTDP-4-dehydrorhamnose reductase